MVKRHQQFLALMRSMGSDIDHVTDYTTNNGGCCFVAGLVGNTLHGIGVPVEAVYIGLEPGLSCGHAWLQFQLGRTRYNWDSEELDLAYTGAFRYWDDVCADTDTVQTACDLYQQGLECRGWNPYFIKASIPDIVQVVAEYAPQLQEAYARMRYVKHPVNAGEVQCLSNPSLLQVYNKFNDAR